MELDTLVRVQHSHALARPVQVAPGGFGTTQAFDLVALRGLAPVEVITAYSLAQAAILLAFNVVFALVALMWAFGWERTVGLIQRPRRTPTTRGDGHEPEIGRRALTGIPVCSRIAPTVDQCDAH